MRCYITNNLFDMKKICTLFFILLTCLSAFAGKPKIAYDKQETDGTRVVCTEYENMYMTWSNGGRMAVSASIAANSDSVYYFLNLRLHEGDITLEKGRKLLIKFKSDEILEVQNQNPIGELDHEPGTDFVYPFYLLSDDAIKKLSSTDEVVKIRIEHDGGYIDRDIKKFNKKFIDHYGSLSERLQSSNSVYDGF